MNRDSSAVVGWGGANFDAHAASVGLRTPDNSRRIDHCGCPRLALRVARHHSDSDERQPNDCRYRTLEGT